MVGQEICFKRKTLRQSLTLMGHGLHSGKAVHVRISPGKEGIAFHYQGKRVEATPGNVTKTNLCTCLGEISTIEHLMSAFAGIEITDAEVELDIPELPALDGASASYCEQIAEVGLVEIGESRITPFEGSVFMEDENCSMCLKIGGGSLSYTFDTGARWPGVQVYELVFSTEKYVQEIAPARTFGFEEQIPQIQSAGLAKGLDFDNALLLGQSGYVNPPKFPDEPVRHKILDMIGDLYLAGIPLRFLDVVAAKSGHAANVRMAEKVTQLVQIKQSCCTC